LFLQRAWRLQDSLSDQNTASEEKCAVDTTPQRDLMEMVEHIRAVRAMTGEAAPGKSGMVGRQFKHCLAEAPESMREALAKIWKGEEDNPQWHVASLSTVHKGKGI
jgi:hypothetical protein